MKRRRSIRISIIFSMFVVLLLALHMTALAAAPGIDEIRYKGKGRIKVEFHGKVRYKHVKVTVKDNNGKKYKVKNVRKDSNDIRFTIVKYKKGKTYKITISGVKKKGTGKYGKVSGRCMITPTVKTVPRLTSLQTESIAESYLTAAHYQVYLKGAYVSYAGYSDSHGYWNVVASDVNGKRCIYLRIDDETGTMVYFEYRPVGWPYSLIIKDEKKELSSRRFSQMIDTIMRNVKSVHKLRL